MLDEKEPVPRTEGAGGCGSRTPPAPEPRKKHHVRISPFGSHTHILSRSRHQEAVLSLFAPNSGHTLSPDPPTHLRASNGVVWVLPPTAPIHPVPKLEA